MIAGLPYDAEVEYIASDGVNFQRIDTGIKGSDLYQHGGLFIEGMVDQDVPSWCPVAGIDDDYNLNFAGTDNRLDHMYCRFNGSKVSMSSASYGLTSFYGKKFIADAIDGVFSFKINGTSTVANYIQFCSNNSSDLLLFGTTRSGWRLGYRIYRAVVRDNYGNTVRDFIPVRFTNEQNQSEGAMYDRVSRKLFRNAGTGAFTIGPDVATPVMGLHFFKSQIKTAKDYVQNGLIAMWDGIENAGWGTHDPNAATWTDLVRPDYTTKFTLLSGDTWGSDNLTTSQTHNLGGVYGGGWYFDGTGVSNTINGKTIELVFRLDSVSQAGGHAFQWASLKGGPFILSVAWGYLRFTGGDNGNNGNDNSSFSIAQYIGSSFDGAFSLPISDATLYNNGVLARSNFSYTAGADVRYPMVFSVMGQSSVKWRSMRIYDKTLTAAEIAANHAIDKVRFNLP